MTPQQFIAKWQRANLSERSACQQHFLDLCDLLGHPKPAEADPDGTSFTFERGCRKIGGDQGWADVWKQHFFGWEYKGKRKNLAEAYDQLLQYREALENPPLLVVCDLDRFEIHTNFTGTAKKVHAFNLEGLAEPANLDILRRVFFSPEDLRPGLTTASVTEDIACRIARIALGMRERGVPAMEAAHFLMKLMFCMFGEDIGLLPEKIFARVLKAAKGDPGKLGKRLAILFESMAEGTPFGADEIPWFNGGLFADAHVVELTREEIEELAIANERDWSSVEPSIFGTLFERTLDPAKRSQIGAHYTSREDILTLLEPVLMAPLRRQWAEVRTQCEDLLKKKRKEGGAGGRKQSKRGKDHERLLLDFIERLAHVRILDPACGSGNFLYVAINLLLDLEKEVITYGATRGVSLLPQVRPTQLHGIEVNPYAQQLAQVVIWIGYLQWMHHNGFNPPRNPVLEPIESIRCMDAILDLSDPVNPKEPDWPESDFIVGNPPFLGGKLLRTNLGDEYVDQMFRVWDGRVPKEGDLCCYWFEKARRQIERRSCTRAGLLATQGIRGGANRKVLQAIKQTGDIFFAESDRDWVLDGAAVHVSMVGFDDGTDPQRLLDGKAVKQIHANLGTAADTTTARPIAANLGLSFMGDTKGGAFDIADGLALEMLRTPNPHGRPNSDVVVPWVNGLDITRRPRDMWIIDFGVDLPEELAARYEKPFEYVEQRVHPERMKNNRESYRLKWWIHVEPRPAMRQKFQCLPKFIATARVAKHRLFCRVESLTLPDCQLIVFARCEDLVFGILHSRAHEVWALRQGTQLETRPRYTPASCFETFPLPESSGHQAAAIAAAARELDELRSRWLNPPEWTKTEVLEFPGSFDGPWARNVVDPDEHGIGAVRWPRVVPKDPDCAGSLKGRTLTNLYNQRPTWLDLAHQKLDAAVFAAYGWDPTISDDDLLERLLALNLKRCNR
jgi:type II restriction/modification system DNA methylase subunit YeeA